MNDVVIWSHDTRKAVGWDWRSAENRAKWRGMTGLCPALTEMS